MYYLKGVGYFGKLNNALGLGDLAAIKTYDQAKRYAQGAIDVVDKELNNVSVKEKASYLDARSRYSFALSLANTRQPLKRIVDELSAADKFYDEVIVKSKIEPAWGVDPKTGQTVAPGTNIPAQTQVNGRKHGQRDRDLNRLKQIPWLWASLGVGAFTILTLLWLNYKKRQASNPWAAVLPRGSYIYDRPAEALRKTIELQRKGEWARFSEFPYPEGTRRWVRERERERKGV